MVWKATSQSVLKLPIRQRTKLDGFCHSPTFIWFSVPFGNVGVWKVHSRLIKPNVPKWSPGCSFFHPLITGKHFVSSKILLGCQHFTLALLFLEKNGGGSCIDTETHFQSWWICRGFFPVSAQILICLSYWFLKFGLMETFQVLPDTSSSAKEHGDSWKLQIGLMIRANM